MGSSEEIYWNMAKNNRKLDAKMPSCPHLLAHNWFIMNCLLVMVASVLVRALPSLTQMLKNKLF